MLEERDRKNMNNTDKRRQTRADFLRFLLSLITEHPHSAVVHKQLRQRLVWLSNLLGCDFVDTVDPFIAILPQLTPRISSWLFKASAAPKEKRAQRFHAPLHE